MATHRRSTLHGSIHGLRVGMPQLSAHRTLTGLQARFLMTVVAALIVSAVLNPLGTVVVANCIVTAIYLAALLYKFFLAYVAMREPSAVSIDDAEALSIPDRELPLYTVLVAAYREAGVISQTFKAIDRLDYPKHLLEVVVLLEADDAETIASAVAARPSWNIEVVLVPPANPRTKPKACNFGLARAHGRFVTIYDAEDRPDPLQLRKAVAAFRRLGPDVACLQAKLSYHNPHQNLITRLFAIEYLTWFGVLLPALARRGGPIPLGGTSMHINREMLDEAGGWDPHNVTEDADLGVRLSRFGFRTEVLDSVTYEEANSDFVNWVKQRSRWYKGYLQTWLVHMRDPIRLYKDLGREQFLSFTLTVGATPVIAFLNPIFWLLTFLWFGANAHVIATIFPAAVYYAGLFCMVFGNFLVLYLSVISLRLTDRTDLLYAVIFSPIYWSMMSIAALKALIQLIVSPSFWEKTEHGLDGASGSRPLATGAQARW